MRSADGLRSDSTSRYDRAGEILSSLESDGFFIERGAIPDTVIEAMRDSLARLIDGESTAGESMFDAINRLQAEGDQSLYRLHTLSTNLAAMSTLRECCAELAAMILNTPHPIVDVNSHVIFSIPNDPRSMWGWHQESTYDGFSGSGGLNFCLPIFERATKENGTMSLLRGSHKLGQLPFEKQRPDNGSTTLLPTGTDHIVAEHEELHFVADPGDVIGFHRDLVHRSNVNRSAHPRVTAVIQFAVMDRIPASLEKPY